VLTVKHSPATQGFDESGFLAHGKKTCRAMIHDNLILSHGKIIEDRFFFSRMRTFYEHKKEDFALIACHRAYSGVSDFECAPK